MAALKSIIAKWMESTKQGKINGPAKIAQTTIYTDKSVALIKRSRYGRLTGVLDGGWPTAVS